MPHSALASRPVARRLLAGLALLLAAPAARAQFAYTPLTNYTVLAVPGATETFAWDINGAGQVVGYYRTTDAGRPVEHGFLETAGVYTNVDVPGAFSTEATGINAAGQIVGWYVDGTGIHGFLDDGGTFTRLDAPGATDTFAEGVNAAGQVVGGYADATSAFHGFVEQGGAYTRLDAPGALGTKFPVTDAQGINAAGQIVGYYFPAPVPTGTRGFLYDAGAFTTIACPGSLPGNLTQAEGIDDAGRIVGWCDVPAFPFDVGFLDDGGTFTAFAIQGATTTFAYGINAAGQIVGDYRNAGPGDPHFYAFVATITPEPGTWALLGAGLLGVGGVAVRRRRAATS